ncbi:Protein of unknown function [Bacillus mycoides]|nr:Protein of unknown function [Bacillus mycoides]
MRYLADGQQGSEL